MSQHDFIEQAIRAGLFSFQRVVASKHHDTATYYADMRAIYAHPALLRAAVAWCAALLGSKTYDFLCGIETASLPLVGALAYHLDQPALYLRTKPKPYGLSKSVEGHYTPGSSVYLLDDLTVTAPESMEFIRIAEEAGLHVKGLIVLYEKVNAGQGRDQFLAAGYEYHSMFSYHDLADVIAQRAAGLGVDSSYAGVVQAFGDNAAG